MAVIYSATLEDSRMTLVRDALNGGKFELLTAADAILATYTLNATSGSVSGGILTFSLVANTAAASASGTLAKARFRTSGDVDVITGLTVGTSGTDVILDTTVVTSGQNITLSTLTVTHS